MLNSTFVGNSATPFPPYLLRVPAWQTARPSLICPGERRLSITLPGVSKQKMPVWCDLLQPGDTLDDRSSLNLVEGDEGGRAILSDRWGVLYVTDESNQVQYVGDNPINAEIEYSLPSFSLED